MRYLLFVCGDGVPAPEKMAAMREGIPAWIQEMEGRGVRLAGRRLQPPATAKSVRVREGQALVVDGPFAETKEFIGGIDLIECGSFDEAVEVAAKHPVAQFHAVEVRRFWDG